jgi:hypothetical protein
MKQVPTSPILFFSFLSLLALLSFLSLFASPALAMLVKESAEIPYQVNHSDRIVIGTVGNIEPHYDNTIFTINVEEWLYSPLPAETIKVRTETGTGVWTEDHAEFEENEQVLLMLKDKELDEQLFTVSVGFPGKRPISDRKAVVEELKAQGKWQEGNETENSTTVKEPGAEKIKGEEETGSGAGSESIPAINSQWGFAVILGAAFLCKKVE